ncbi:MAG: energy transducer TonB [Spirochaetota bacterium]|nr:energy transducer TonB [Spirochaetota bacterium]
MKFEINSIIKKFKYILFALIVSSLLFLMLPVSYYIFHSKLYNLINVKQLKSFKVETIKVKKKEKKIKEIEKTKKKKLKKFQNRFLTRFNLDLSVLSGEGSGAGALAAGFENVIEEGEADIPPIKRIFNPPNYPERAKNEGIEGTVIAKLLIDENGNVRRVRVIKAPKYWGFDDSVIEAAKSWKFEPAKLNNMPVKVWATQVIEFRL